MKVCYEGYSTMEVQESCRMEESVRTSGTILWWKAGQRKICN